MERDCFNPATHCRNIRFSAKCIWLLHEMMVEEQRTVPAILSCLMVPSRSSFIVSFLLHDVSSLILVIYKLYGFLSLILFYWLRDHGQSAVFTFSWLFFRVGDQNQVPTRKTSQHLMFYREALSSTYGERESVLFVVIVAKIFKDFLLWTFFYEMVIWIFKPRNGNLFTE